MTSVMGILLIAVIVSVDNSLLAGLLLPHATWQRKRVMIISVGILLGVTQVVLAASIDQMLQNIPFRILGIILLGWMSIRTLSLEASRSVPTWLSILKLWLYTVVGNLDNMFWLGSQLKGDRSWLVFVSLGTIPLFVVVALFLSEQCEKQTWLLHIGAGMMAWTAASLMLDIPVIKAFIQTLDDAPQTTFQYLITVAILGLGLGLRSLFLKRKFF